jgi:hypothetical protein
VEAAKAAQEKDDMFAELLEEDDEFLREYTKLKLKEFIEAKSRFILLYILLFFYSLATEKITLRKKKILWQQNILVFPLFSIVCLLFNPECITVISYFLFGWTRFKMKSWQCADHLKPKHPSKLSKMSKVLLQTQLSLFLYPIPQLYYIYTSVIIIFITFCYINYYNIILLTYVSVQSRGSSHKFYSSHS